MKAELGISMGRTWAPLLLMDDMTFLICPSNYKLGVSMYLHGYDALAHHTTTPPPRPGITAPPPTACAPGQACPEGLPGRVGAETTPPGLAHPSTHRGIARILSHLAFWFLLPPLGASLVVCSGPARCVAQCLISGGLSFLLEEGRGAGEVVWAQGGLGDIDG